MSKSIIFKVLGFSIIMSLFITACSTSIPVNNNLEDSDDVITGMANPAAVYCEGLGYSLESVQRDGGIDADCIFLDGSRCPQWGFLSGRCGQEYTYCYMEGNELEEGTNVGSCRFPDNSFCDEYLFFTGDCSKGDNPGEADSEDASIEDIIQIQNFYEARDFIAEYFFSQYGIEQTDPWMEQNITPEGLVGSSTFRYVSGLLTIKISAPVVAPENTVYTIEEASYIVNGFYWEGTLSYYGDIEEILVLLPGTVLNEESARDAVLDYLVTTYDLSEFGEWEDQDFSQTGNDTLLIVYTSGPWTVKVEFAPAAPLISNYLVTVESSADGFLWEGDITLRGEITEISFSN